MEWENGELTADMILSGRDNPDYDGIFYNQDNELDYSYPPEFNHCCSHSIFGELHEIIPTPEEIIPQDTRPPLVKHVTPTQYGEAKLMNDVMSGSSEYDILHIVIYFYFIICMVNKSTREWFSKKQATAVAATCGSEFGATQTCVEQIIDLRNSLSYLGAPIPSKDPFVWRQQISSCQLYARTCNVG
jgi:hypothetical protein